MKESSMKRALLLLVLTSGGYLAGIMIVKAVVGALGSKWYSSAYTFYAPAWVLWLSGIAAILLAMYWSLISIPRRFWPAAVSSAVVMGCSCCGLARIHIVTTTTVNGHLQSRFEFRWLFVLSLWWGVLTLAYRLWKCRNQKLRPAERAVA